MRPGALTTRPAVLLVVLTAVLVAGMAAGCSRDPGDAYCEVVEEHQAALSDIAASDDPGALFEALDEYDALAEEAPRDIADEWADVVTPLRELEALLAEHDVDVSTYSAQEPPEDLDAASRREVRAAGRTVGSERTVEAMAALEQHALDVCGTPLSR